MSCSELLKGGGGVLRPEKDVNCGPFIEMLPANVQKASTKVKFKNLMKTVRKIR